MKKLRNLLVVTLVLGIVIAFGVSAASSTGSSLQKALTPILDLFGGLVGLIKDPFYANITMRLILWIVAINMFLLAIRRTPMWGDNPTSQKNAKMIAVFLSLGGILVIPSKAIEGLFFYVGILVIIGLVVAILNMVRGFSAENGSVLGGSFGIAAGIIILMIDFAVMGNPPYNTFKVFFDMTLFDLLMMAAMIIIIAGIATLGGGIAKGNEAHSHGAKEEVDVDVDEEKEDPVKALAAEIKNVNGEFKSLENLVDNIKYLETQIPNTVPIPPGAAFHNTALTMRNKINSSLTEINNRLITIMGDSNYPKLSKKNKNQFDKMWANYLDLVIEYSDAINKLNAAPRAMGL